MGIDYCIFVQVVIILNVMDDVVCGIVFLLFVMGQNW